MKILIQRKFYNDQDKIAIIIGIVEIFDTYYFFESTEDEYYYVKTTFSEKMDLTFASEVFRDAKRRYNELYIRREI